jgi:hypothetical protein
MTVHQLHEILSDLDDTRVLVLDPEHDDDDADLLVLAWRTAAARATRAFERWRADGGPERYAAYRALADLADAAQDALAAGAARRALVA